MKTVYLSTIITLSIVMLFLPLVSTLEPTVLSVGTDAPPLSEKNISSNSEELSEAKTEQVRVYITEEKKVQTISLEEYIFGVVSAEMPALYEKEALKAQAVAAYTYLSYKKENGNKTDYDITDSYKTDQAYITRAEAREKWGEDASQYEEKINGAVKETLSQKITYNGKTILAAYHAISFGVTEDAASVWGEGYPYLSSVDSVGDKLSPNYLSRVELTAEELESKLGAFVSFSGERTKYFGNAKRTAAGTVESISVCGKEVNGSDIRTALDLRSANFTVKYENEKFSFEVLGYGHSLGLSQYGAHYMAMQGKTYKEILLHYYKDCKIE